MIVAEASATRLRVDRGGGGGVSSNVSERASVETSDFTVLAQSLCNLVRQASAIRPKLGDVS